MSGSCIFFVVVAIDLSSGDALVGDAFFTGDSGFGLFEGESSLSLTGEPGIGFLTGESGFLATESVSPGESGIGFLEPCFCFLVGEGGILE